MNIKRRISLFQFFNIYAKNTFRDEVKDEKKYFKIRNGELKCVLILVKYRLIIDNKY